MQGQSVVISDDVQESTRAHHQELMKKVRECRGKGFHTMVYSQSDKVQRWQRHSRQIKDNQIDSGS